MLLEEISHRLRTPLTSLITYLSLMELRLDKAAREGDARADLRAYAELEAAALADAFHMGAELDRLLARSVPVAVPPTSSISAPQGASMGDRRFDRLWDSWDARLAAGKRRLEVLEDLTERDLAELLAADAGAHRSLERNVIATELTNRLGRRGRPTSDILVAKMARSIAHASTTSAETRRLVADSTRAREEAAQRRSRREPTGVSDEHGERHARHA